MAAGELHQGVEGFGEVVEVPGVVQIGQLALTDHPLARPPKPGAKFTSGYISRVFDPSALTNIVFYHVPVTLLQLVEVVLRYQLLRLVLSAQLQKLGKCASLSVLLECFALGEVLEHLEPSR